MDMSNTPDWSANSTNTTMNPYVRGRESPLPPLPSSPTACETSLPAKSPLRKASTAEVHGKGDLEELMKQERLYQQSVTFVHPAYQRPDTYIPTSQTRGANSVTMPVDQFEKLYKSPLNQVHGEMRSPFANPTPVAIVGMLLSLMPLSMTLLGWRGAGGNGEANIGFYFYAGGLLSMLGALGEWLLGNTFSFVVFGSFAAFWLAFGATLQPIYNAYGAFENPHVESSTGWESMRFNTTFGYLLLAMAILSLIYLICSIRINVVFFLIFLTLVPAFALLSAAFLYYAQGKIPLGRKLEEVAGGLTFITCLLGWYEFIGMMLASVDFPVVLPVGDLSGVFLGASERRKANHVD